MSKLISLAERRIRTPEKISNAMFLAAKEAFQAAAEREGYCSVCDHCGKPASWSRFYEDYFCGDCRSLDTSCKENE